jgi:adenylylsulfate kinase
MQRESHKRSILKAFSYRLCGTAATSAITLAVTGRVAVALAIGGFDFLAKIAVFFFHERLWSQIRYGKYEIEPVVFWFTGLSGSGKTTLSKQLADYLQGRGLKVEYLDGDRIRKMLPKTGFTREQREDHIRRVGILASYLQKHGVFVVTALISPYEDSRKFVRECCKSFVEVYVSTPLEACEKRDVKGLYAKARNGELKNFTGIDDPYEVPQKPELSIDTSRMTLDEATQMLTSYASKIIK